MKEEGAHAHATRNICAWHGKECCVDAADERVEARGAAPAPSNTRKGEKKTFYSKSGVEVLMIESKRMSLTTVLKMSDLSRVTSVQIFPIWLGATFSC